METRWAAPLGPASRQSGIGYRADEDSGTHRKALLDGTVDGAFEWLEQWQCDTEAALVAAQEAAQRLAELTATAGSARGEVEVTVGVAGELIELRLSDEVRGWRPDEIAGEVLRLVHEARRQMGEAVAELAPAPVTDPQEVQAVLGSYLTSSPHASQVSYTPFGGKDVAVW